VNNSERVLAISALTTTRHGQKGRPQRENDQILAFGRSQRVVAVLFFAHWRFRCLGLGVTYRAFHFAEHQHY
jgi:hypothetical protein